MTDELQLVKTCDACPEQYDVYAYGVRVGFLHLRHGFFFADYYASDETKRVYEAEPRGDGFFEEDEREYYIDQALQAIKRAQGVDTERTCPRCGYTW